TVPWKKVSASLKLAGGLFVAPTMVPVGPAIARPPSEVARKYLTSSWYVSFGARVNALWIQAAAFGPTSPVVCTASLTDVWPSIARSWLRVMEAVEPAVRMLSGIHPSKSCSKEKNSTSSGAGRATTMLARKTAEIANCDQVPNAHYSHLHSSKFSGDWFGRWLPLCCLQSDLLSAAAVPASRRRSSDALVSNLNPGLEDSGMARGKRCRVVGWT